jgi:phosphoribosylanthranilate isomerase
MPTRVKVCGITRAEDALLASRLGADAIGFVFWEQSPRAVSADTARAISAELPPSVMRVGVFVNAPVEEVSTIASRVPLDVVQLHGDETVERYARVGARLVKAVTLAGASDVTRAAELPDDVIPLVDAADAARRGGTGSAADWALAGELSARRRLILAGGLTADNVVEAVRRVRPWAVDVSSGVEDRPGVKSETRLAAFISAVAGAGETERS